MNLEEKLKILADSAKYDASCSSSGSNRKNNNGIGSTAINGICHSYSSDGRCISLLKILLTNACAYNCEYCINRKSNYIKRAIFTPEEICYITINFYKRNYIEGLFLSSAVIKKPDYTMQLMIETVELLRKKYHFNGYIHAKAIPGASPTLIKKLGSLVDRLSANIELPSEQSIQLLAPSKHEKDVTNIMKQVKKEKSKDFVPAGQSTQMIIGATNESDYDIINKSKELYDNYKLKRVFYSAYIPVNKSPLLPSLTIPPLKREHRLYQADWLMRFYGFKPENLLSQENKNFNLLLDPKITWALNNLCEFPKEINKVDYFELLKIPGIGPKSAKKIISSRQKFKIKYEDLKKIGVVTKRAKYFILCDGKYYFDRENFNKKFIEKNLIAEENKTTYEQMRLFEWTKK